MNAKEEAIKTLLEKKHQKHVLMIVSAMHDLERAQKTVKEMQARLDEILAINVEDIELDTRETKTYTASNYTVNF